MTMRSARDYRAAIATEPRWNVAGGSFQTVPLLAEALRLVGARERRNALSEQGLAGPPVLVRTHVEGGLTLAADAARLVQFLPFVTGGAWTGRGLPTGSRRQLICDGAVDPLSLSLVRRLADRDDWQHFSGLKVRGLRLVPTADAGLVMMLDIVGAEMGTRARVSTSPASASRPPLRLQAPPKGFVVAKAGADALSVADRAVMLAGFEIGLHRLGMLPHFALAANSPQMVPAGRLAARIDMRLLATDQAKALADHSSLTASFRFVDEASRFEIRFPALAVQDWQERVDADGGPALIHLRARAEAPQGWLLRIRESLI